MKGEPARGYVTDAELHVWRLVALGRTNKEIAVLRKISQSSVSKHREALCRKTGAKNSADFARLACERGVIPINVLPLISTTVLGRTRHSLALSP